ncbi:hypothetical protein [Microbacterium luteum]|uniref:hypothetical protein n=1 Tax=Microbacterium luteum TaxID=2782167 RepID=UPI001888FF1B|nr:hypothetical protein [Microbacterium luteum]
MSWPEFFYPHEVDISNPTGGGGLGGGYADAATVSAEVKDRIETVRTPDGAEAVSSAQVSVPLDTTVRLGALVTTWKGTPHQRTSEVIALARNENGDPLDEFTILYLK